MGYYSLFLLAVVALTASTANNIRKADEEISNNQPLSRLLFPSDINKDIEDFLALIPLDQISNVIEQYITNDAEVANFWYHINTAFFKNQAFVVEASPEWNNVYTQVRAHGFDDRFVNKVHIYMNWEPYTFPSTYTSNSSILPPTSSLSSNTGGLRTLVMEEIYGRVPILSLQLLAVKKLLFSSTFIPFTATITSTSFLSGVSAIINSPSITDVDNYLRSNNVDVDVLYEFINKLISIL